MTNNILTTETMQSEIDRLGADNVRKDAEILALKNNMRIILGYATQNQADAVERIKAVAKKSLNGEPS